MSVYSFDELVRNRAGVRFCICVGGKMKLTASFTVNGLMGLMRTLSHGSTVSSFGQNIIVFVNSTEPVRRLPSNRIKLIAATV